MLIVISGIDGSGKTLQVRLLERWLQINRCNPLVVKAYNDEAKIACRPFMEKWVDDVAIMFLFQALHAQQYALTFQALQKGHVVIADRWDETYLAYHQNFGPLAPEDQLRNVLNKLAFRELAANTGFILKVPVEVARFRRETRGKVERFEDRNDAYYDLVQETYCQIARSRGWHVLDGTQKPQEIHERIIEVIQPMIGSIK